MVSYDRVLPIGTVVILKGAQARLMILGYQRYAAGDDSHIYDYCGCPYPEGFISPEQTAIFDHDRIERIIYMGLQNPAQIRLADQLRDVIEKRENENHEEA